MELPPFLSQTSSTNYNNNLLSTATLISSNSTSLKPQQEPIFYRQLTTTNQQPLIFTNNLNDHHQTKPILQVVPTNLSKEQQQYILLNDIPSTRTFSVVSEIANCFLPSSVTSPLLGHQILLSETNEIDHNCSQIPNQKVKKELSKISRLVLFLNGLIYLLYLFTHLLY